MLKINNKIISGSYTLEKFPVSSNYDIKYGFNQKKVYTEMIIDVDNMCYIHLLRTNNNDILFSYKSPSPQKGSGIHRYYVLIYEQDRVIEDGYVDERSNFNLNNFVKNYNLKLVSENMFTVEN